MTGTVKAKGRFGRIFDSLRFNWTRRRYIWRASFFYKLVSWILMIGLLITTVFYYLITKYSFFVNYSCSARSINMINLFMISISVTTAILLVLSVYLARMCNLFSNYTMRQFVTTGRFMHFAGCTVKWLPWVSAVVMWIWLAIQFSSLIWIFVNPKQWCDHRFDESAVNAVRNCRLILNKNIPCQIVFENVTPREIRNCNHPEYLITRKIVLLALKDSTSKCSIEDVTVCNAYRDAITKDDFNFDEPGLGGCYGKIPQDMSSFIDEKNSSDLYKYILLFNIFWSVMFVVIVCIFYFIKSVTKFDAIIYQPKDPSDNIIIKIIRPFTPWTK
ncbi:putative integral membrane protein [Theileria parva strain Muguga]|uniref:putative integral membrane protein n=1 Tax=Theileria parva strain Muguga TaxID=333668 RepID=UPI001C61EBE9|nr:putative integral membrane protein [Theileria parva strain Muguga]EAN34258.2 putative integral membrane protein [Theileria parva strain Muguga]